MTIPWQPPQQEPPKYEPPKGYKLKKTKPFYRRFLFWIPAAVVTAIVIAAVSSPSEASKNDTAADATGATVSMQPSTSAANGTGAVAPPAAAAVETTSAPAPKSTAAATKATKGTIGTPTPVDWGSGDTGTVTVYSAKWVKPGADDIIKPDNGAYVVVDIGYVATAGTVSYNPLYWTLRDTDGREYDYTFLTPDGSGPALQSGDLAPGSKARGVVAFDAPQQAMTLELSGGLFSGTVMTWQIPAA